MASSEEKKVPDVLKHYLEVEDDPDRLWAAIRAVQGLRKLATKKSKKRNEDNRDSDKRRSNS